MNGVPLVKSPPGRGPGRGGTVADVVQRGGVLDRSPQWRAPREPGMERRSGRVPAQGESGIAAEAGKFVDL